MFRLTFETVNRGVLELSENASYPYKLVAGGDHRANNHVLFHFALWLIKNPNINNFRVVCDFSIRESPVADVHRHSPLWIIFGQREDRKSFERWFKRYSSWFVGNGPQHDFFPQAPINGRHSLTFVEHPASNPIDILNMTDEYPEDFIDQWSWIICNCHKPVYMMPKGLAFKSVKDAINFKLRWSCDR